MFRIDGPGATPDNKFSEGDPASGTRATVVTDEWLNAVQEEIAHALEAEGVTLDKEDSGQLKSLFASRVIRVASVAEIEALPPSGDYQASLSGLRWGDFEFDSSDLSLEVSSDPQKGVYIAPSTDPTGASGAWVRRYDGYLKAAQFGADPASSANADSIQAMMDFMFSKGNGGAQLEVEYEIEKPLVLTQGNIDRRMNIVFSGPGGVKKAATFTGDRLLTVASDNFDEDNIVFFHVSFDGVNHTTNGVDWFSDAELYKSIPSNADNTTYAKSVRFDNCNFNNCYLGTRVSGNSNTFFNCAYRGNRCGTLDIAAANDIRYIGCSFRRGRVGAHVRTSSASLGTVGTCFVGCVWESNTTAGLALDGRPNNVLVDGYYFENNGFDLSYTDYEGLAPPAEPCHIFAFGSGNGSGYTTVGAGEFWPSPAGVHDVYGSRLERFTFVNADPASIKPTGSIFNGIFAVGKFNVSSVDLSAATLANAQIVLNVNGQDYHTREGELLATNGIVYQTIGTSTTSTVATTSNANDVYEVTVVNSDNCAVTFLAHRGSSTVVEIALAGGTTGKPTAAWSGDDLQVTAGSRGTNRVSTQRKILI